MGPKKNPEFAKNRDRRLLKVESIFGPLHAYPDDLITNQILKFGAHARPELAMLLSFVASRDKVFDVGAHIGTFAIPIAQRVGAAGRVLAVEAMPRTCRILQKNLRGNGLEDCVEIVNGLIAPAHSSYAAVRKQANSGGTHFVPAEGKSSKPVRCTTIDELCRQHFSPRVIKIDVEGYEGFALTTSEAVRDLKPIVYAEISAAALARAESSIDQLDSFFAGCGFFLYRNIGPRNAADDMFRMRKLDNLAQGGKFFDVLAIHGSDERRDWLAPHLTAAGA